MSNTLSNKNRNSDKEMQKVKLYYGLAYKEIKRESSKDDYCFEIKIHYFV